jgi:peptidoglycan lytic transglycosylase
VLVRVTIIRVTMLWIVLLGVWLAATTAPAEARLSRRGQVGWASWYGSFHHGKPTATGEHFSMSSLTAAHRTLPLGTTVVVTNLRTRRQVALRINDRGPYVDPKRRIIDLSRAAARRLGFEHPGLAPVRLVVQKKASARSTRVTQAPLPRSGRRA